jgi:hypothetical protein
MNTRPASSERALLAMLREILSGLQWPVAFVSEPTGSVAKDEFDALVQLRSRAGAEAVLAVECKPELRPAAFQPWAQRLAKLAQRRRATPVLGMPTVSPRMAELCQGAGWSWFDLSGNCRIDVPGLLHIERTGIPSAHRAPRPGANLGTAAAARVLRVLLSPGHAGRSWTQRALQVQTASHIGGDSPVSIGLVNKLVRHLLDQGFVEAAGDGGIRVRDLSGLLGAWRAAYRFDRHERRSYFTLLKPAALDAAFCKVAHGAADAMLYAAFSAAERQAPHVRQAKTWIYVRPPYRDALVRDAAAKEVESGENLVVLVPEDSGVFLAFNADSTVGQQTIGSTDPVQTYIDLFHAGGRGEEAAQALLEQRILPAWKAVGVA